MYSDAFLRQCCRCACAAATKWLESSFCANGTALPLLVFCPHPTFVTSISQSATWVDAVSTTSSHTKRLTENELSDFSRLWHDGCGKTIIEAQDVEQNHSPEV